MILAIDTATTVCSVALSEKGELISLLETSEKNAHSATLTLLIREVMSSCKFSFSRLDAIAVSAGPGSYTGLRIGVATAKGLCYALNKPLIAIPTLQAMALGIASGEGSLIWSYCPMIDARRMEVFCAIYDGNGMEILPAAAEIIDENSFSGMLEKKKIVFGGEGSEKCKSLLKPNVNAVFLENFTTSAKYMLPLAEEKFSHKEFENLAYFEPFYLKEFVAGKPRVKGLV